MGRPDSSGGGGLRGGGTEGDQTARFLADLQAVAGPLAGARIGIAVSGGPDSLALLLLAAAALPGRVEAATVDHGLRNAAKDEAAMVGRVAAGLGVPHVILAGTTDPDGSLQMRARALRYRLLGQWAREQGLALVLTAHHRDDQAETVLLRLARGSGVAGLGGIRPLVPGDPAIARPLLGWTRRELAALVAAAELDAVDDPANRDPRHDRTAARAILAREPALPPARLAAAAAHARDADAALDWVAGGLWNERCRVEGPALMIAVEGLPRELRRRLLVRAVAALAPTPPRDDRIARLLDRLDSGRAGTIGTLRVLPGARWRIMPAPLRRTPAR